MDSGGMTAINLFDMLFTGSFLKFAFLYIFLKKNRRMFVTNL